MGFPLLPKDKQNWIAVIIVAVAGITTPVVVNLVLKADVAYTFNETRDEWLDIPAASSPNERYIRGKLLPFGGRNPGGGSFMEVDKHLLHRLPDELKPNAPEEVGTVALLD